MPRAKPQPVAPAGWRAAAAGVLAHLRTMDTLVAAHRDGVLAAGYRHHTLYGLVLAAGRVFEPPPRGADSGPWPRLQMGQCYANCHGLCVSQVMFPDHPRVRATAGPWRYCEGYAVGGGLPVPLRHAWLVHEASGRVADVTWVGADAYVGLTFTEAYRARAFAEQGEDSCALLDRWQDEPKWPLMRMTPAELAAITLPLGHEPAAFLNLREV